MDFWLGKPFSPFVIVMFLSTMSITISISLCMSFYSLSLQNHSIQLVSLNRAMEVIANKDNIELQTNEFSYLLGQSC